MCSNISSSILVLDESVVGYLVMTIRTLLSADLEEIPFLVYSSRSGYIVSMGVSIIERRFYYSLELARLLSQRTLSIAVISPSNMIYQHLLFLNLNNPTRNVFFLVLISLAQSREHPVPP